MAKHVFQGGALLINGEDWSAQTKGFAMQIDAVPVDITDIQATTRVAAGGLKSVTWSADFFADPLFEGILQAAMASSTEDNQALVLSYYPGAGVAALELVYMLRALQVGQTRPWTLGDAEMLNVSGVSGVMGSGPQAQNLVRGKLSALGSAVSAGASGSGVQLGALTDANAGVLMAGHLTGLTGTAVPTFILESDDNSGFTSATTRASLAVSAVGKVWTAPVVGPVTDDWWRVRYTIAGTGTATFKLGIGRT